ncbi:hypothetical protein [Plantibacter sp. LMC-P-059a]|uniref:hypothetical protein n=1 Tax=Plantibacter sp. LMC-P-059a TaxID=3040297 RepID=UPI00254A652C|nr:hypothetical protein [Plantibacter sp. LMC-P-059a]
MLSFDEVEPPFHIDESCGRDAMLAFDLGSTHLQQPGDARGIHPLVEDQGDVFKTETEMAKRHDPMQSFQL